MSMCPCWRRPISPIPPRPWRCSTPPPRFGPMKLPRLFRGRRRRHLLRLLAIGIAQPLLAILFAWEGRHLFEASIASPAQESVDFWWQILALPLIALAIGLLRRRERVEAEMLGQLYVRDLRKRLFHRILVSDTGALNALRKGQLLIRLVGDLNAVRQWISLGVARLLVAAIAFAGVLVALWTLHPYYALGVALGLGLTATLLIRQGARLRHAVSESRRRQGYLAANLTEKIAVVPTIRLFARIDHERRRLARQNRRLIEAARLKAARIGDLRATVEVGIGITLVAALAAAGRLVPAGLGSPGDLLAVFFLVAFLATPLRHFGRAQEYRLGSEVALDNLQRLADRLPRRSRRTSAPIRPEDVNGEVVLENVSVQGALRSLSVSARADEKIAILGPNGAGKSTLLCLLAGLRHPDSGRVLLGGVEVERLPPGALAELVGYVGPEAPLLRGTLRSNILYGLQGFPAADAEARLQRVAERCGVSEFASRLADGLETRVSEGGSNLSQGQQVRVGLARALIGEPRILLLDETDAHLDPVAQEALEEVIRAFPGTVLLASHRNDALRLADRVWLLDHGELIAAGEPESLLARHKLVSSRQEILSNKPTGPLLRPVCGGEKS
ncbi:MAG: ABC transporter ATP-binding protein [Gammaproteobacteria bacterium]|nr:MAG: ABC transporter ATP-binding protein [Gammaproteobacteria bacterium]